MLFLIRLESCKSAARFKYIWRVSTDVMRLLYILLQPQALSPLDHKNQF